MSELVLKWAWRHQSLDVQEFDSLDAAIRAAIWARDAGDEALETIEVVRDGESTFYGSESAEYRAVENEQWEKERRRIDDDRKRDRVSIEVRRDDEWASIDWLERGPKADELVQKMRAALGDDRVRVRPVR